MTKKLRTYEPIWIAVKNNPNREASLAADPALHARIIKAVIKEKYMDKGWGLIMLELGKKYKLHYTKRGKVLTFRLEDVTPIIYKL